MSEQEDNAVTYTQMCGRATRQPDYKAATDRLEAWMRKKMPNGVHRLMEVATADAIALALIDAGRMVRVGDDARWPDPPDPDAECDAAVDAFSQVAFNICPHDGAGLLSDSWRQVVRSRDIRNAAKAKRGDAWQSTG